MHNSITVLLYQFAVSESQAVLAGAAAGFLGGYPLEGPVLLAAASEPHPRHRVVLVLDVAVADAQTAGRRQRAQVAVLLALPAHSPAAPPAAPNSAHRGACRFHERSAPIHECPLHCCRCCSIHLSDF